MGHPLPVLVLTTFDDDEYVHFAVKHGAVGYLLKNMTPEDLILSVRAVMRGLSVMKCLCVASRAVRDDALEYSIPGGRRG